LNPLESGDYSVISKLGEGACASVFLCKDNHPGKKGEGERENVAIKIINLEGLSAEDVGQLHKVRGGERACDDPQREPNPTEPHRRRERRTNPSTNATRDPKGGTDLNEPHRRPQRERRTNPSASATRNPQRELT
jgi:hypothetical protein